MRSGIRSGQPNDPAALRGALLCGEGLMLASDVMAKAYAERGYVRRVLAGWSGPSYDVNALFPRGRVQSPKVRAFVDFLVERLSFDSDDMRYMYGAESACQGSPCSDTAGLAWVAATAATGAGAAPATAPAAPAVEPV